MDDITERKLIKDAQKGSRNAFERLIDAQYDTMFRYAHTYTRNTQDAEDIAQDAAMKLARSIRSFKFKSKFSSWLYVLVMNTAKDFYKKQNRQPIAVEQAALETASQQEHQEEEQYARQVLDFVHGLPEGEKDALLLVMQEGLNHKEAAKLLGVKESTISWRIHEARKKLDAAFKNNNAEQGAHYG